MFRNKIIRIIITILICLTFSITLCSCSSEPLSPEDEYQLWIEDQFRMGRCTYDARRVNHR